MLEHADAHSQDDSLPDEGASHDGRSDNQPLEDGVEGEPPEPRAAGKVVALLTINASELAASVDRNAPFNKP